jgi:ribosomal protein S8
MLLSEKYAKISTDFNNDGFRQARELIEKDLAAAAGRGKRECITYPKNSDFKTQIMAWLEDEGFYASWQSCQREGTWIRIIW